MSVVSDDFSFTSEEDNISVLSGPNVKETGEKMKDAKQAGNDDSVLGMQSKMSLEMLPLSTPVLQIDAKMQKMQKALNSGNQILWEKIQHELESLFTEIPHELELLGTKMLNTAEQYNKQLLDKLKKQIAVLVIEKQKWDRDKCNGADVHATSEPQAMDLDDIQPTPFQPRQFYLRTYQGRNPASTNGCAMIAPLNVSKHLETAGGATFDQFVQVMDVDCVPRLEAIRGRGSYDMIFPSVANSHLTEKGLLHQHRFVGVVGGNIIDPIHLERLMLMLDRPGTTQYLKAGATLFFRGHVISILKYPTSPVETFVVIDSMPTSDTQGASVTICEGLEVLKRHLHWYACTKLSVGECQRSWDETRAEDDPRIYESYVWAGLQGGGVPGKVDLRSSYGSVVSGMSLLMDESVAGCEHDEMSVASPGNDDGSTNDVGSVVSFSSPRIATDPLFMDETPAVRNVTLKNNPCDVAVAASSINGGNAVSAPFATRSVSGMPVAPSGPTDWLLGSGAHNLNHEGTMACREAVLKHRDTYDGLENNKKDAYTRDVILVELRDMGVRFWDKDKDKELTDEKKIHEKIKMCIREKRKNRKKE